MNVMGTFVLDASIRSGLTIRSSTFGAAPRSVDHRVSYVDSIDCGIIACERAVPHVGDIPLGFGAAVAHLAKTAVEKSAEASPLAGDGAPPDPSPVSSREN